MSKYPLVLHLYSLVRAVGHVIVFVPFKTIAKTFE